MALSPVTFKEMQSKWTHTVYFGLIGLILFHNREVCDECIFKMLYVYILCRTILKAYNKPEFSEGLLG